MTYDMSDLHGFGQTWYVKIGLLSWEFDWVELGEGDPRESLRPAIEVAVLLLGDLGRPWEASWLTESGGEDALVQEELPADLEEAVEVLGGVDLPDVLGIHLYLNVYARLRRGDSTVEVPGGAYLVVEYDPDLGSQGPGVFVSVNLNTNLYARRTWLRNKGDRQDNTEIAELNAWRVNDYLRRLSERFGRPVEVTERIDYEDQVDEGGFVGYPVDPGAPSRWQ